MSPKLLLKRMSPKLLSKRMSLKLLPKRTHIAEAAAEAHVAEDQEILLLLLTQLSLSPKTEGCRICTLSLRSG